MPLTKSGLDLLAAVAQRLRAVAPADPHGVTQRSFDDATPLNVKTAQCQGAALPSARAICQRLSMTWPKVKSVALGPRTQHSRALGLARADRGRKGVPLETCISAIAIVATALAQTPTRGRYDEHRTRIVATDARAHQHGASAAHTLPSLNQIDEVLDQQQMSWTDLLARAGLTPSARDIPTRGMPLPEAIEQFAEDLGGWPGSKKHLRQWGAHRGLVVQSLPAGPTNALIEEAIANAAGTAKAGLPRLRRQRLDLSGVPAGTKDRQPVSWSRETLIAGLVRALDLLGPGQTLTQRTLAALIRETPEAELPAYSVIQRHAGQHGESFVAWRDEAARRRSEQRT